MLYSQEDVLSNKALLKRETSVLIVGMIPMAVLLVAGFIVRNRLLAIFGMFFLLSEIIFLCGMRVFPLMRYGNYLSELNQGLTHDTRGIVIGIGEDRVFEEGVYFKEVLINIYKDLGEDGVRRFLFDCGKQMPDLPLNSRVNITSHGVYIVGIAPLED